MRLTAEVPQITSHNCRSTDARRSATRRRHSPISDPRLALSHYVIPRSRYPLRPSPRLSTVSRFGQVFIRTKEVYLISSFSIYSRTAFTASLLSTAASSHVVHATARSAASPRPGGLEGCIPRGVSAVVSTLVYSWQLSTLSDSVTDESCFEQVLRQSTHRTIAVGAAGITRRSSTVL